MDYYTYAYLRKDLSPYYVGKGKGDRIFSTLRRIAKPKDANRIVFLRQGMSEKESFSHEIEMIKTWGRKDLGTGLLRNMTDGGEGASGHKLSDEHKAKMSLAHNGKILSEEHKAKIRLSKKYTSNETRAKMRSARLGIKLSEEHKAKIGLASRNMSDETRVKIGLAHKGRIFSDETRANMRLAWTFRKLAKSSKAGEK